jgi:hypothetical protein
MKTSEVVRQVRNWHGPVCVGALARDDVYYVRVVKSDLLTTIANFQDGQIECAPKNGTLFVDRA